MGRHAEGAQQYKVQFMNNFRDNLHAVLTARSGKVPFGELYHIVHDVLRASGQSYADESMSPRVIVSRWLSEGFIEANIAEEKFVLCRPTLSMVREGKWVLTGAKSTNAELVIGKFLDQDRPSFIPPHAPPKRFFKTRSAEPISHSHIVSIVEAGADVVGDATTPAWRVRLKQCPGISAFLTEAVGEMDRRAWLYQYRRWRISPDDFCVSEHNENNLEVTPGFFICTNPNPKFNHSVYIAVNRSNEAYRFTDWRWLYVWALSEFWGNLSPFFYNPNTCTFGVFLLPNSRGTLDNWLPKEISSLLGSCCFSSSMSQRELQDVDHGRLKPCVLYPEVPHELAERVHQLLGFSGKHPLRYLFY